MGRNHRCCLKKRPVGGMTAPGYRIKKKDHSLTDLENSRTPTSPLHSGTVNHERNTTLDRPLDLCFGTAQVRGFF
jgi:hypothetical protein